MDGALARELARSVRTCGAGQAFPVPGEIAGGRANQTGSGMATPPLNLDRASGVPLHRRPVHQPRPAIATRRLPPGARLPPIRELADDLGVARITVASAYDGLVAEGLVVPRVGSGTRVADDAARLVPLAASDGV